MGMSSFPHAPAYSLLAGSVRMPGVTLPRMGMDVDGESLTRLLDVQAEDTALKRLAEQRASLPEAARLAEINESLAELRADLDIASKQAAELGREQRRLEGEMELADGKIGREEGRLFSGGVSNPKELAALSAEVDMLKRQRGELEDALLEVMVQKDQIEATVVALTGERDGLEAEAAELAARVEELVGAIDEAVARHATRRTELAGSLPPSLLGVYEGLRATKNGVGAAALEGHTCMGCHTELPQREVERLKSEGGLQRCDHCRRILVIR